MSRKSILLNPPPFLAATIDNRIPNVAPLTTLGGGFPRRRPRARHGARGDRRAGCGAQGARHGSGFCRRGEARKRCGGNAGTEANTAAAAACAAACAVASIATAESEQTMLTPAPRPPPAPPPPPRRSLSENDTKMLSVSYYLFVSSHCMRRGDEERMKEASWGGREGVVGDGGQKEEKMGGGDGVGGGRGR